MAWGALLRAEANAPLWAIKYEHSYSQHIVFVYYKLTMFRNAKKPFYRIKGSKPKEGEQSMTMTLCAVTEKGGSGKSTLITNLAVYWALHGERVLILDLDPKPSCKTWEEKRQENKEDLAPIVVYGLEDFRADGFEPGDLDIEEIVKNARESDAWDRVLIDLPGADNDLTRSALLASDIAAIPIRVGGFDHNDVDETLSLITAVVEMRAKKPRKYTPLTAALLFNNTRRNSVNKRALQKAYKGLEYIKLLDSSICGRDDIADASTRGLGVIESKTTGPSAREVRAVARELENLID